MERTTNPGAATALGNALRKTALLAGIIAGTFSATAGMANANQSAQRTSQYERQLENYVSQEMRKVEGQTMSESSSMHAQEQSEVATPAGRQISPSIAMLRGNEESAAIRERLSEENRLDALRYEIPNLLRCNPEKYVSDYVRSSARNIEQGADMQVASIEANADSTYVALQSNPQQPDVATGSRPKR